MELSKVTIVLLVTLTISIAEDYILNPHVEGTLKQQVIILYYRGGLRYMCSGTMITDVIAVTAGHCLEGSSDVTVYPAENKCTREGGISACKVSYWYTGESSIGESYGFDIGLVRLAYQMLGMRSIDLTTYIPKQGDVIEMAGTGKTNKDNCKSWMSLQRFLPKSSSPQWFYTESHYDDISGGCGGDSGGPAWKVLGRPELVGVSSGVFDPDGDKCTNSWTVFSSMAYFKDWIEKKMNDELSVCPSK